jgi:hypothetical protein
MGATATAEPIQALVERTLEPAVLLEGEPIGGSPRPDFKVFALGVELLKANEDGDEDGVRRVRCIASSSVKDLHGDTMTAACVRDMEKQAEGLNIFLYHSYRMPEDVFGMVEKARSKKVSSSEAKAKGWIDTWDPDEDVVLLQLDIALSEGDRIDQVYRHMEKGVRLGVSIGANIEEWEEDPEFEGASWWPPLIINKVDLLEASIVGIPANPLSWVEGATKGLIRRGVVKGATEETFQEARRAYRKAAEEGQPVTKKTAAEQPEKAPEATTDDSEATVLEKADGPEEIVAHNQSQVEAGLRSRTDLDALEDDIQKSIDFALANGVDTKEFEGRTAAALAKEILSTLPDAEKADEPAKEANPEDEEAQESGPDSGDEGSEEERDQAEAEKTAAAEMAKLTAAGTLKSVDAMVGVIEDLLQRNAALAAHNERLVSEKATLLEERDTADFNATKAVELVREIMEIPLARKSAPIERTLATGAEKLKGKFSDEILSILYPPEE